MKHKCSFKHVFFSPIFTRYLCKIEMPYILPCIESCAKLFLGCNCYCKHCNYGLNLKYKHILVI